MEIIKCKNASFVPEEVRKLVEKYANKTIEEKNSFKIGLAGGALVGAICAGLKIVETDWSKWQVVICDEREPLYLDNATVYLYKKYLIANCGLNEEQIYYPILDNHPPSFDMVLVGMDYDGHIRSIFDNPEILFDKQLVGPVRYSTEYSYNSKYFVLLVLAKSFMQRIFGSPDQNMGNMSSEVFIVDSVPMM